MALLLAIALVIAGGFGGKPVTGERDEPYLPIPLETPPCLYALNEEAYEFISLELLERTGNRVTDYENWFDYIMDWPAVTYHNGGVNDAIRGYGPPYMVQSVITVAGDDRFYLYMIIYDDEKTLAFYGSPPNRFDVILDPRLLMIMDFYTYEPEMLLDFITYAHCPGDPGGESDFTFQELQWADVEKGILYVSTAHRTYAESSGGMNAYLTAIDLETLEVLWRSRPLVSNSENFLIVGDTIVTGYGFTAEDDFIYLLNRLTGEVMESYRAPSAPEYFYLDQDRLYVRCYDSDCVYSVFPAER